MESDMNFLVNMGLLLGIVKFSVKAGLGCGFTRLRKREVFSMAFLYFSISILAGILLSQFKDSLDQLFTGFIDYAPLLGIFQSALALILIYLGLKTASEWHNGKKDHSRKTFLSLSIPCPGTIATILLSCLVLMIMGFSGLTVGLLIGGFFFATILGISFFVRLSNIKKTPEVLGAVMIFFGLFYLMSILIIPAYMPTTKMGLDFEYDMDSIFNGFLFTCTLISIGFIFEQSRLNGGYKWNCLKN
jgi:predicted transporter